MAPKSLAVFGLAAAATTGISFATTDLASAASVHDASVPSAAKTARPATAAPIPAHLTAAVRSTAPVPTVVSVKTAVPATYTVAPGDSLWKICRAHGCSMTALAAANSLQLSEWIYPGQVLKLPGGATVTVTAASRDGDGDFDADSSDAAPAPAWHATATPVSHVGAGRSVASSAPVSTSGLSSVAQCIINRESSGRAQVVNASGHWGLAQFSRSTWIAYGGSPAAFGNAPASVQISVLNHALAQPGGINNWAPSDGC